MGSLGAQFPERGLFSRGVRRPLEGRTWLRNSLSPQRFPPVPLEKGVAYVRPCVEITHVTVLSWFGRRKALWPPGWEPMVAGGPGTLEPSTTPLTPPSWAPPSICGPHLAKRVG